MWQDLKKKEARKKRRLYNVLQQLPIFPCEKCIVWYTFERLLVCEIILEKDHWTCRGQKRFLNSFKCYRNKKKFPQNYLPFFWLPVKWKWQVGIRSSKRSRLNSWRYRMQRTCAATPIVIRPFRRQFQAPTRCTAAVMVCNDIISTFIQIHKTGDAHTPPASHPQMPPIIQFFLSSFRYFIDTYECVGRHSRIAASLKILFFNLYYAGLVAFDRG